MRNVLLETKAVGRTALYDGVVTALQHLENGKHSRKALVILSDGGDNASRHDLNAVLRLARQSNATIYAIGFYDVLDKDRNPKALQEISKSTGGEFYRPNDAAELHKVWTEIAEGIRSQYTLGYFSSNAARDGSFRSVKIMVVDRNGRPLHARTRGGYMAPKTKPVP
jgi:Ca-activated chloride channel family protein